MRRIESVWFFWALDVCACQKKNVTWVSDIVSSQFLGLCHPILPQCGVDPIDSNCRTFYPELASDARGEVHRLYFGLVIAVAAVRLIVELSRAVSVFAAYRRINVLAEPYHGRCYGAGVCCSQVQDPMRLYWIAELVGASPFAPLLWFALSRAEFTVFVLQREPTPADFAFRALHAGFLTSIPLLAVNSWYLLRVTQYGLAPAGWLSLIKGLILVPRLLFQAYRATRPGAGKHRRSVSQTASGDSVQLGMELQMDRISNFNMTRAAEDLAPGAAAESDLRAVLGTVAELSTA
jgi:hypothetical protein